MASKLLVLAVVSVMLAANAANLHKANLHLHKQPIATVREYGNLRGDAVTDMSPNQLPEKDHDALVSGLKEAAHGALEDAVTKLVLSKDQMAFGATPFGNSVKTIMEVIQDEMLPAVLEAHKVDQEELDRLASIVAGCETNKDVMIGIADESKVAYEDFSPEHKKCREGEAGLVTALEDCQTTLAEKLTLKEEKCAQLATIDTNLGAEETHTATVAKRGMETTAVYLQRLADYYCGLGGTNSEDQSAVCGTEKCGSNCQYICAKTACEEATENHEIWTGKCNTIKGQLDAKLLECNNIQDQMDAAACKRAVGMKDACETYGECFVTKKQAYDEMYEVVMHQEKDRKEEWSGLKRMVCLMQAFSDGKVTAEELEECKKKEHSTQPVTILYPELVTLQVCSVPKLYPTTGEYKLAEFATLPALAKGKEDANECTGVEEISTEPAQGSPDTCTCVRLTMNGPYAPGPLVKCENCLDIRKSTDANSCPGGAKLFAPQSREDWKTFLASTDPLKAPNFIVDVTRPQSGCGGCTTESMNSGNAGQASWETTDRAPWWLRSTAYSEPNGDYHANCYLELTVHGEDDVTFQDNNCEYHSKSYFCQLQQYSKTPKEGSPDGCVCERVTLTQAYTGGVLLRCKACLMVSKTTDKNSCPTGFKIFSPRTRGDWKAILQSVTPLKSPNWIVDITRPADGCGGCNTDAMESENPAQKTWMTSDGSAWWLRSSAFTEPNEESLYQANCYMDLGANPANENLITFTAKGCDFKADAYYCQLAERKKLEDVHSQQEEAVVKASAEEEFKKWSIVMKTNGDSTFGYSAALWTNDELLNGDSDGQQAGNAKYQAFLDTPFNRIMMCVGEPLVMGIEDHCLNHAFGSSSYTSAKALFTSGYIRDPNVDKDQLLKVFGPTTGSYRDCGMQRPGFNIECKDGNKARWGFCNNCASQACQTSDNNDADAAIGIGLNGQSDSEAGAGWTNYFASGSGTCAANSRTEKNVWLYVYNPQR